MDSEEPPLRNAAVPPAKSPGFAYKSAVEASEAVRTRYSSWSDQLTQRSTELSFAVIAANWACFGSVDKILGSLLSKWSLVMALTGLLLNLLGTWRMTEALRKRLTYAEDGSRRWEDEFNAAKARAEADQGSGDYWPFVAEIPALAFRLRCTKALCPVLGGVLFVLAVIAAGR